METMVQLFFERPILYLYKGFVYFWLLSKTSILVVFLNIYKNQNFNLGLLF